MYAYNSGGSVIMLHGPNPTKTRFILKHTLRTLQYLRAHGSLQNSNPSTLCGS